MIVSYKLFFLIFNNKKKSKQVVFARLKIFLFEKIMSIDFVFDENNFIDDDELMSRPVSTSLDDNEYTPFSFSSYQSPDLKNLINLVNVNIEIYNINMKNFKSFITELEKQIGMIETNISQIFVNLKRLIYQIVVLENNYNTDLYNGLKKIIINTCHNYFNLLRERLLIMWRYSEKFEENQRQCAQVLKKISWILKNGHFNLRLIDKNKTINNEISKYVIKRRGLNDTYALIMREIEKL